MTRRFTAILLMLLFAANICGATVTHHLCGKVLQYISLTGHKKDSKCCCKGSGMDKGCCKTTYIKVKVDDEKTTAKAIVFTKLWSFEGSQPACEIVPVITGRLSDALTEKEYIPQKVRWHRENLFIYYCVFRI